MRLDGVSGSFEVGDEIQGASSGDTGIIEGIQEGSADTILKLSGIGQTEVFEIAETLDNNDREGSGTIVNGTMNLSSFSISHFQRNETITGQSSGAEAVLEGVYGQMISVTDISGTFSEGETIKGGTTGAEATLDTLYAAVPGMFKSDTTSEIVGEPTSGGYEPVSASVSESTWPTKQQGLDDNYYLLSKTVTFTASGSSFGPVNTIIVTANWEDGDEIVMASAPLKDTPPSEVVSEDTTLNIQHRMAID